MNRVVRDNPDIAVAFASNAKVIRPQGGTPESGGRPASPATGALSPPRRGLQIRRIVKAILRAPAKLAYRLMRPFLRPVAFRMRTFLLGGLQAELSHVRAELNHMRNELLEYRKISCTREQLHDLRRDLLRQLDHLSRQSLEEWQRHSSAFDQSASILAEMGQRQLRQLDRVELYAFAAAKRFAVYSGNDEVLVRTEVGYVLCQGSDHALVSTLAETGDLERGTRLLIQRLLKPGDVFIDVGANIGLHTLAAARAMNGCGKIIAFEPSPITAGLLTQSIWLNGFSNITEVHQAAVSTSTGKLRLHLGKTSGHHSIFPLGEEGPSRGGEIEVPAVKVDDIVDAATPVTLLKIDVEGAELQVLETARNTILRNPDVAIIAEFGPSHLRRTGQDPDEWLRAFSDLGLEYRAVNAETGALETWKAEDLQSVDSINLLFAKAGSRTLLG